MLKTHQRQHWPVSSKRSIVKVIHLQVRYFTRRSHVITLGMLYRNFSTSKARWCSSWSSGCAFYWSFWPYSYILSEKWLMFLLPVIVSKCSWADIIWITYSCQWCSIVNISCYSCSWCAKFYWKQYTFGHDNRWSNSIHIFKTLLPCYFYVFSIESTWIVEQVILICRKTFCIELVSIQRIPF